MITMQGEQGKRVLSFALFYRRFDRRSCMRALLGMTYFSPFFPFHPVLAGSAIRTSEISQAHSNICSTIIQPTPFAMPQAYTRRARHDAIS